MRILSLILTAIAVFLIGLFTKSPHGENFKVSCSVCHSANNWKLDKAIYSFNHATTKLPLVGQHVSVDCKMCHPTLVFAEAKTGCVDCHKDVHETSVGFDCNRCHTPNSWLVNNATQLHQLSRFPLVGVHAAVDCYKCHKTESLLNFKVIGVECNNCHNDLYLATTQPNHVAVGYSTQCNDCHTLFAKTWNGAGSNHSFFPLTQGHAIADCLKCHTTGTFGKISTACISCHQTDFNSASNPNHQAAQFSTNCSTCHSTAPGWKPATFDHSVFPLTQGHANVDCLKCHTNGNYTNIPTTCISCHQTDFNNASSPSHQSNQFSTNCTTCHTTAPGWTPATFNHTNFPLTLGHANVDCSKCHTNGNYNNSLSTVCSTCHQTDYNNTNNPSHSALGFSTTCTQCHTTNPGWTPAQYTQHDSQYFPIYSGNHKGAWTNCTDCHQNTSNYALYDCIDCHTHNKTDTDARHRGRNGYSYTSTACYGCHKR